MGTGSGCQRIETEWERTLRHCRWVGDIKDRASNYVKFDGTTFFFTEKDGMLTCEGKIKDKLYSHAIEIDKIDSDPEKAADEMFLGLMKKCFLGEKWQTK